MAEGNTTSEASSSSSSTMGSMAMYFHQTTHETIWFEGWVTSGPVPYGLALLGLFGLCLATEAMSAWRLRLERQQAAAAVAAATAAGGQHEWSCSAPMACSPAQHCGKDTCSAPLPNHLRYQRPASSFEDGGGAGGGFWWRLRQLGTRLSGAWGVRGATCGLYAINVMLSYLIMLAVMSYNLGVAAVVLVGLATGHLLFHEAPGMPPLLSSLAGAGAGGAAASPGTAGPRGGQGGHVLLVPYAAAYDDNSSSRGGGGGGGGSCCPGVMESAAAATAAGLEEGGAGHGRNRRGPAAVASCCPPA